MSIVLTVIIIFLIVISILKNNVNIAESWTRTFGRWYTSSVGKVVDTIPFSLTESLLLITIASCLIILAWAFSLLGTKNYWGFANKLLMIGLVVVGTITMYNASVGMGYHRKPLPIERYNGVIDSSKFKQIATYFVEDYNKCADELNFNEQGEIIAPYSQKELINRLKTEFHKLDGNDYFTEYTPTPKPMKTSGIFTTLSIVGVYFGVFGEVNYSTFATNAELPFYIAHEMCHSKGVLREDDAQLLAFYVCITSADPYIRYSAYWNTIDRIINIASLSGNPDDYQEVKSLIGDKIRKNNSYIYKHWKGMTFLSDLGDKINDWYLRTFGQIGGTGAYNDNDPTVDPGGHVIYLSNYQGIYFKIYYEENS